MHNFSMIFYASFFQKWKVNKPPSFLHGRTESLHVIHFLMSNYTISSQILLFF